MVNGSEIEKMKRLFKKHLRQAHAMAFFCSLGYDTDYIMICLLIVLQKTITNHKTLYANRREKSI